MLKTLARLSLSRMVQFPVRGRSAAVTAVPCIPNAATKARRSDREDALDLRI
jgi:hypothetical protein